MQTVYLDLGLFWDPLRTWKTSDPKTILSLGTRFEYDTAI